MADLLSTSFFTLPAELQIKVYDCILDNVSDKPTPQSLEPYSAIILSCKKTKNDFEHEWIKVFNKFVSKFVEGSDLRFMPVKTLRDAQHMRYIVPYNMTALHTPAMKNVIVGLPSISRLLTLRLDKTFPVYQGNMRDFRHAEQYRALLALWANIYHGISPMPEEYKPCHPVRMRIELWPPQLVVARYSTSEPVARGQRDSLNRPIGPGSLVYYRGHKPTMPKDNWQISLHDGDINIVDEILRGCVSFEDLRDYRGLIQSSTAVLGAFQCVLWRQH